jgi:MoaA/NifB/PqqE/SkfB family radical SAM enzyme
MWWHHTLGNVKERPFSEIWTDLSDPVFAGLKQRPRPSPAAAAPAPISPSAAATPASARCKITGDPWAEDPGCYLTDAEIGVDRAPAPASLSQPFRGVRHEASV